MIFSSDIEETLEAQVKRGGERRRRPVIYLAGPYRDARGPYYIDRNINDAREVAARLWAAGYAVITPHMNTRFLDGFEGIPDDAFLQGDLDMIERCDFIVLLPRWQTSSGTKGEKAHAELCGIPVFEWEDAYMRAVLLFAAINVESTNCLPSLTLLTLVDHFNNKDARRVYEQGP